MAKGLLGQAIDHRKNREKERQRKIREATGGVATPQSRKKAASKRRTKRKA